MAWGRLHDRALGNVKLLKLSDGAWRMWGCALIHCQDNLTDGFVDAEVIETFRVRANRAAVIRELTLSRVTGKAPLWKVVRGGYQIHDYLDWNPSAASIRKSRERNANRQKRWRRNGVTNAVSSPSRHANHIPLPLPSTSFGSNTRARAKKRAGRASEWLDSIGYCFHKPRCTDSDVCRKKRAAEKNAQRGA